MEEFHARLGQTPHTWTEWSSSQLLQNTPLHPIAEWGRRRFGADLPPEQRLANLENTLELIGLDPTEYAPLLSPLVDVLLREDRAAKLAPEELRRRQLAAMTAWILAAARTQAVVLAFEDLHRADPTSLDLMRALAERGAHAPLLIIATARPEFRRPWSVRSHHSVISLSPPDSVQIGKMVRILSSRHARPRTWSKGERAHRRRPAVHRAANRAARKRSRRPCSSRWPRASIGSARRVRPRRSAPCWAADSRIRCSNPWLASTKARCDRRWSGLPRPTFCSSRAMERKRPTASSTR